MVDASATSHAKPHTGGNPFGLDPEAVASWRNRRHLLDTRDLTKAEVACLLKLATHFKSRPADEPPLMVLGGKTVAHVFYENSTRTRASFEMAARKLGADVLNLDAKVSSVTKGETIVDTARQLVSIGLTAIVQRHSSSGSAHLLANELGEKIHVINAGDGWAAHPTQGLLDLFTMLEAKGKLPGAKDGMTGTPGGKGVLEGCKIAIVGDILHSRVARSNIYLLKLTGAQVHLAGPPTLMPQAIDMLGVTVHNRLEPAIEHCDFVIMLRLQMERMKQGLIPTIGEYKKLFRLDRSKLRLAKPDARVLHPGPVNRDIELTDDLADDSKFSLMSAQVENGVFVRMAALYLLLSEDK
jgi:aspartate carbamoyltransferase catalytic subunit